MQLINTYYYLKVEFKKKFTSIKSKIQVRIKRKNNKVVLECLI